MKAPSIQARLLAGAAVAIFVALGIAWCAMGFLFERHVSHRLHDDLKANAEELAAHITIGAGGAPALAIDLTDPRFHIAGSGWFWQVSTPDGVLRSDSLAGKTLNRLAWPRRDAWTARIEDGPEGNDLYYLERLVSPAPNGPDVLVQFAHDHKSIATASTEFSLELGVFLLILGVFLCAASWAQVYLGLIPFKHVRNQLSHLERDPAARLEGVQPRELRPLVDAINSLAATREHDVKRARWRAADLAHSLKTPLAVLGAQARTLRSSGAEEAAAGIERAVAAAATAVQYELAQTRSAMVTQHKTGAAVRPCVEQLVQVVEQTEAGALIAFDIDVDESLEVAASDEALTEALGPLIENAARYARRRVRVSGECTDGKVAIYVEDDGPGIAHEHLTRAIERGVRLDQSTGQGLGLSIARDIVTDTGGAILLDRSHLGGLRVTTVWPAR